MTMIPQFTEFASEAVLALGNRWPLQLFGDPLSMVNPAAVAGITSIVENAAGDIATVTAAASLGITSAHVGGQVLIAGVTEALFNGVWTILTVASGTSFTIYCVGPAGGDSSSGGTVTTTSLPAVSTFVPAFPTWVASTAFAAGDIIVPVTQPTPAIYLQALQSGNTGTAEPSWPTGGIASIGREVSEVGAPAGNTGVQWKVAGLLNSAAPPPFGAAHVQVYAGSLWVFNTRPTDNTTTNLDGPSCMRMSDINNPNSWNPVNAAFIDKDDGSEGTGLSAFTITAQGIPPEGSLVAFKNFAPYQIVGVFGATDFAIQRVKSVMGCLAPRSIQFVPGFGLMRWTHLGFAVFDGVEDRVVSEEIRPYLFPENDLAVSDITVMDANYQEASQSGLTAQPAMYVTAIPVGNSGGRLSRILCYDLVLKAWSAVDLPFTVAFVGFFASGVQNPVTVLGGYLDGALQRWQSGDADWYANGNGDVSPSQVSWSVRTAEVASSSPDQRLFARRVIVRGTNYDSTAGVTFSLNVDGNKETSNGLVQIGGRPQSAPISRPLTPSSDFEADFGIGITALRFSGDVSGTGNVEVQGFTWYLAPKTAGVVERIT